MPGGCPAVLGVQRDIEGQRRCGLRKAERDPGHGRDDHDGGGTSSRTFHRATWFPRRPFHPGQRAGLQVRLRLGSAGGFQGKAEPTGRPGTLPVEASSPILQLGHLAA